jgi:hypothetical protein
MTDEDHDDHFDVRQHLAALDQFFAMVESRDNPGFVPERDDSMPLFSPSALRKALARETGISEETLKALAPGFLD